MGTAGGAEVIDGINVDVPFTGARIHQSGDYFECYYGMGPIGDIGYRMWCPDARGSSKPDSFYCSK